MKAEILRMECISKTFNSIKALDNVNLNVFKGEVLALIGENGSGKSSLIKIAAGIYSKDSGRIYLNEKEVQINTPHCSQKLGISVIHQEPKLVPNLSVAENIFLGKEKCRKLFVLDRKSMYKSAVGLLDRLGLQVDVSAPACNLSVAQRQLVEIAKALSINSSLIIMDEPTSSLTDREVEILKKIIYKLKEDGVSIIFISHKLNEVLDVANRITVLRDGLSMGTYPREICNEEMLISLMAGRDIEVKAFVDNCAIGREVLRVENISTRDLLKDISFTLRSGEILGIAGLIGSGRTELLNVIFGISPKSSGIIIVEGNKVEIRKPRDAIKNKIGLLPEDRKLKGLIPDMSIKKNISLSAIEKVTSLFIINIRMQDFLARYFMHRFSIKASGVNEKVKYLSEGNQQKVVISKWLTIKPKILMLDEPTKGIDIIKKKEVLQMIRELAKEGKGIIFVSSEIRELLSVCDRILVMSNGRINEELSKEDATEERILSKVVKI